MALRDILAIFGAKLQNLVVTVKSTVIWTSNFFPRNRGEAGFMYVVNLHQAANPNVAREVSETKRDGSCDWVHQTPA